MSKYALWNKQDDIFTLGRDKETGKMRWTAREYIDQKAPWADNPSIKVIVGGGAINGTMFMEFEATKDFYVKQGMPIPEGASDEEVLALMEEWDNRPPDTTPTSEERIAAALEFQNLMSL